MRKLGILGAGTAGTMMLNKLSGILDKDEWQITIVDQFETHYYQPGFLFIPFGIYNRKDVIKPKRDFFPAGTDVIMSEIEKIQPEENRVLLKNNAVLKYDYLIIATKTYQVPAILKDAAQLNTEKLTVIAAQNGIDVEELLIPTFGESKIAWSATQSSTAPRLEERWPPFSATTLIISWRTSAATCSNC